MNLDTERVRIQAWVRRLHDEMEFSIFPCHHPLGSHPKNVERGQIGKIPAVAKWEPYQGHTPSDDEIEQWFFGESLYNIAIVTGSLSRVVVLDLDDAYALAWANDGNVPETPLRVSTQKGEHWYYLWNLEGKVSNSVKVVTITVGGKQKKIGVDVRGEGGYVIAPGSMHRDGHIYGGLPNDAMWRSSTISDLPFFPLEILASSPAPPIAAVPAIARSEKERKILAYAKTFTGVGEGERNNSAYWKSAKLLRGFGAMADCEDLAWDLMCAWNQRNSPPMPEKELRRTFNSAKNGKEEIGAALVSGQRSTRPASTPARPRLVASGGVASQVAALFGAQPEQEEEVEREPSKLPMVAWEEIPRGSGWSFILEPMVPRGAVTILSGDGGLGKSLLACRMAANLAAGRDLMGKPLGRSFRSTVFFMEDALGEIKRRLSDMGYDGSSGAINIFDNREHKLSLTAEHVGMLDQAIVEHGSDLVFIDPLISATSSANVKMNSPEEARACIDLIGGVAKARNISAVLVHHHNDRGTIQGGKAWENAVRSHCTIHRHPLHKGRYLVIHAKNNCGEMPTFVYELVEAVQGVRGSIVCEVIGESPSWDHQRLRDVNDPRKVFDQGCLQEALLFLRKNLQPGWSQAKRYLVEKAARDGIRISDLNQAANSMGVKRVYVPQETGDPLLCWQMPEGVVL